MQISPINSFNSVSKLPAKQKSQNPQLRESEQQISFAGNKVPKKSFFSKVTAFFKDMKEFFKSDNVPDDLPEPPSDPVADMYNYYNRIMG